MGFVRSIELAKLSKGELPEKIWIKVLLFVRLVSHKEFEFFVLYDGFG